MCGWTKNTQQGKDGKRKENRKYSRSLTAYSKLRKKKNE